jgi:site-specific DNA-methyltransferase (adenine-specific)
MPRAKRPRSSTSTSAFGSPGRVSHDSSEFYGSRLYQDQPKEGELQYIENPLPAEALNRVICASAEQMAALPDCCVHLMVTSPPYNVGKVYDQDLTLEAYLEMLRRVWQEVWRVLVPGGRACINVANLGRKPYIPLHALIMEQMAELGFLMRGEIIWNKAASASSSTAWGSWRSASNPTLRDVHEYILVYSKGTFRRENPAAREATVGRDEFLDFTKSIWTFPAESARKVGHPAPFPLELPRRLIELYTFQGEVVLDPFMGSGQTALAAVQAGRSFVGYEIDPVYAALARQRVEGVVNDEKPLTGNSLGYIEDLRKHVGAAPLIMVGAATLVLNDRGELLMLLRSDNGRWGIPGGALEPGECLEETAQRETLEETGLRVEGLHLLGVFSGPGLHYCYPSGDEVFNVTAVYLALVVAGQLALNPTEHSQWAYFPLADLPEDVSPPIRPILDRLKESTLVDLQNVRTG